METLICLSTSPLQVSFQPREEVTAGFIRPEYVLIMFLLIVYSKQHSNKKLLKFTHQVFQHDYSKLSFFNNQNDSGGLFGGDITAGGFY